MSALSRQVIVVAINPTRPSQANCAVIAISKAINKKEENRDQQKR